MCVVIAVNVCVCQAHTCNEEITDLLIYLLPVFIVEQNLVGISVVMLVLIYRHLGIHIACHRAIM